MLSSVATAHPSRGSCARVSARACTAAAFSRIGRIEVGDRGPEVARRAPSIRAEATRARRPGRLRRARRRYGAFPRGCPNLSVAVVDERARHARRSRVFSPDLISIVCVTGSPLSSVHAFSLYLPGARLRNVKSPPAVGDHVVRARRRPPGGPTCSRAGCSRCARALPSRRSPRATRRSCRCRGRTAWSCDVEKTLWKIGSKFGNDTVEPAGTASMRGANCRSRCSMTRCLGVRFFHFPLAGSSVITPSSRPATRRRPSSSRRASRSSASRLVLVGAADRVLGLRRACPSACVLSAVVIAFGRAGAEQRIERGERARRRQPLRRAEELLGVRALAAHARRRSPSPAGRRRRLLPAWRSSATFAVRLLGERCRRAARPRRRRRIDDVLRSGPSAPSSSPFSFFGNLELVERADQILDQRVELLVDELQAGVRRVHVAPAVLAGPAGRRADELDEQRAQTRRRRC